jgi:hypothetical protein
VDNGRHRVAELAWFLLVVFSSQAVIFIGLVLWSTWTERIKPRLTPPAEIGREADAIIAGYADPESEAFARLEAISGTRPFWELDKPENMLLVSCWGPEADLVCGRTRQAGGFGAGREL